METVWFHETRKPMPPGHESFIFDVSETDFCKRYAAKNWSPLVNSIPREADNNLGQGAACRCSAWPTNRVLLRLRPGIIFEYPTEFPYSDTSPMTPKKLDSIDFQILYLSQCRRIDKQETASTFSIFIKFPTAQRLRSTQAV